MTKIMPAKIGYAGINQRMTPRFGIALGNVSAPVGKAIFCMLAILTTKQNNSLFIQRNTDRSAGLGLIRMNPCDLALQVKKIRSLF